MAQKMVITAAICGAETTREHNPNLPITPEELAEDAYNCYKAGAAIVHLHVRDENGNATMNTDIFSKTMKLIKDKCDVIIEVTTGGAVGDSDEERMKVLELKPEMASLDCGTVNFGDEYIENTLPTMRNFAKRMKEYNIRPTLEIFDLGHIYNAERLIKEDLLEPPYHYGFVLNVPGAARYDVETLAFFAGRIPKGANWTAMGIGRASLPAQFGACGMNGWIRVGFEDNVYYSKGVIADSNAQFVERAVRISKEAGFEIATPNDVREILKLRK